ncbi:Virginiamycin B lyase [subsurface metagenome]
MNFESDENGVMWYYNFPDGSLYRWDPRKKRREETATLPPAYSDGSIAVAGDGKTVYIGWWLWDKRESALYRYNERRGLEKVLERPKESWIRAVEVTVNGVVFVGCSDGIYRLSGKDTLEPYYIFPQKDVFIASDSLTSDEAGNLYFSAHVERPVIYRLSRKGKLERIAWFASGLDLPFGLSWDRDKKLILGVRKEKGEIVSIDLWGNVSVLNHPSGLSTPIAIEEHPKGTIFINGDEIGLLTVDANNQVGIYCRGMCCYQPPPADFTFDRNGLIYYTCAAPGFDSEIVTIDQNKRIKTLTRNVGSPAGIDSGPDDKIYYTDFQRGTVNLLKKNGQSVIIIDDLYYPLGLAVDDQGNFWVGTAEKGASTEPGPLGEVSSTSILKFGSRGILLETIDFPGWEHVDITFFDVDAARNLYVPIGDTLLRRDTKGKVDIIAESFSHLRGAKVFSDGYLYFVDYGNPALYRIKIE